MKKSRKNYISGTNVSIKKFSISFQINFRDSFKKSFHLALIKRFQFKSDCISDISRIVFGQNYLNQKRGNCQINAFKLSRLVTVRNSKSQNQLLSQQLVLSPHFGLAWNFSSIKNRK